MAVTVAAEVREINPPPARARDGFDELARTGVGKVAVPAADPLFQGPRTLGVSLQELGTVVGLDDDDVAFADVLADVLRCVAQIGEPGEGTTRGEQIVVPAGETEADRFMG